MPTASRDLRCVTVVLWIALLAACGEETAQLPPSGNPTGTSSPVAPKDDRAPAEAAIKKLHAALKEKNPQYADDGKADVTQEGEVVVLSLRGTKVSDLSPVQGLKLRAIDLFDVPVSDISVLKGMPLEAVYLEGTLVRDLSPLKGMQIVDLYLSRTQVSDLSPLAGMPLRELNLLGAPVSDLSPLASMPLRSLWLNSTPVKDLTPLRTCFTLESLTLYATHVTDLTPIADLPIQRLHIGNTKVTDLRPLAKMNLTRLIFDVRKIQHGLEIIREMSSIQEIGPDLDLRMTPREFWQRYDAGEFK